MTDLIWFDPFFRDAFQGIPVYDILDIAYILTQQMDRQVDMRGWQ